MTIHPHEVVAIERQLTAEHADRQAKWGRLGRTLDIGDFETRLEWARRREDFFVEVGSSVPDSDSLAALRAMKDRYRGERIFVIGNRPSLNRTPLHLLEDEYTFGVNRICLLFDRISWRPTFYTTVDWRVAPDCAYEINKPPGYAPFLLRTVPRAPPRWRQCHMVLERSTPPSHREGLWFRRIAGDS